MKTASTRTQLIAAVALLTTVGLSTGCKKDEAPPPMPTTTVAEEKKEVPFELKPEDAGAPVTKEPAKKKRTRSKSRSSKGSLKSCCAALRQNAANAPEPTKGYMTAAAATCDLLATQGKDKSTAAGMLLGVLKGAGLPTQCK